MKTYFKKTIKVSVILLSVLFLLPGCLMLVDTGDSTNINNGISFTNAFPFTEHGNWWMLTDEYGRMVKIEVINAVTSNQKTYFQIRYSESGDTVDNWFKKSPDGIFFCDSIDGDFDKLFPAVCSNNGGEFDTEEVSLQEGLMWVDRKESKFIVTLGDEHGVTVGDHMAVFHEGEKVGFVQVDETLDVVSYVSPKGGSGLVLTDDYYQIQY